MSVSTPVPVPSAVLSSLPAAVWPAHALAGAGSLAVVPSGEARLDAELPGGGWPLGGLTELLQPVGVCSEWRLLAPALARSGTGLVVLVGAPHVPFAPALQVQGLHARRLLQVRGPDVAARLWATEQALRCADVDAVLVWLAQVGAAPLRRLQMAAATYGKLLFAMRPLAALQEASPAVLRLQVQPERAPAGACAAPAASAARPAPPDPPGMADALLVYVRKRRGPPLEAALALAARPTGLRLLLAAGEHHALDCTA